MIFHRPELYSLLLSKVPVDKISFNKKIVSVEQNEHGVTIQTADSETFHGDILVGADGAYSAVRKQIYKEMADKKLLPASDSEAPKVGHICLVGTTHPLDPEKFPALKDNKCHFTTIIGHAKAHTWVTCTLPDKRMAYSLKVQLDEKAAKEARFRNTEWAPESNEKLIQQVRNFPIRHFGDDHHDKEVRRTVGDLIDATDPELISRVFLEVKLQETWYYGRTVLVGDAIHKMQPSAGQGAVNAMEDAVILTNCLYDLADGHQPVTPKRITEAFRSYREQRYCHAKYQVENSSKMTKIMAGQTWSERLFRGVIYNMPKWLIRHTYLKQAGYRPQIMFLPTVPVPPGLKVVPQMPSRRYTAEQAIPL
ncbi:hypothetical protein B0O80DRAFT_298581 [Mortierella sp. GBAus27b]|nr:hypothetical protein B0O80DRAFT_298581 [Mortierella sp. GBAus27b]